mmetsp:Transcript_60509/g.129844  ORF Transcript_60509/g.129844 Transcript_60509/m.129844 type:complete len:230 (-) Transcript_60509:225-914(-)
MMLLNHVGHLAVHIGQMIQDEVGLLQDHLVGLLPVQPVHKGRHRDSASELHEAGVISLQVSGDVHILLQRIERVLLLHSVPLSVHIEGDMVLAIWTLLLRAMAEQRLHLRRCCEEDLCMAGAVALGDVLNVHPIVGHTAMRLVDDHTQAAGNFMRERGEVSLWELLEEGEEDGPFGDRASYVFAGGRPAVWDCANSLPKIIGPAHHLLLELRGVVQDDDGIENVATQKL